MSYLAALRHEGAPERDIAVRIPTKCIIEAIAVCIGLNEKPEIINVQLTGKEAPRKRPTTKSTRRQRR